uniref:Uncharacterized protein n=1 Tax=Oryza sativa subsp. japonica TaxID=39947 RepID=Q6YYW4_ORYSJ|nr:hypothetical protein [Oryza sativa Japonica Group]BAD13224.1 hypothetical protein [Oryza sativa Japonica Group]
MAAAALICRQRQPPLVELPLCPHAAARCFFVASLCSAPACRINGGRCRWIRPFGHESKHRQAQTIDAIRPPHEAIAEEGVA